MYTARSVGDELATTGHASRDPVVSSQVLGVDMLRMKTMQAGDGGELLARTLNDLSLLAQAADAADAKELLLEDASAGLSPLPWQTEFQKRLRRVRVRDANDRLVGERTFPKGTGRETLANIARTTMEAVNKVNVSGLG